MLEIMRMTHLLVYIAALIVVKAEVATVSDQ